MACHLSVSYVEKEKKKLTELDGGINSAHFLTLGINSTHFKLQGLKAFNE
jgi:hypothetical protein